jgi:hypothetical protein
VQTAIRGTCGPQRCLLQFSIPSSREESPLYSQEGELHQTLKACNTTAIVTVN